MSRVVNPAMLTLARDASGLTQEELAAAIGVTQAKISKYENGFFAVSEEDLIRISKALDILPEFFFQEDKVYGLGSSFLFHRKRKTVPIVLQRRIQAQVNILRMQIERLLRGIEIDPENGFDPIDIDQHGGDAEKIARTVRATWRLPLGPVANVTACAESAGGVVMRCGFNTPLIDAVHLWLPGLPPLFFLNEDLSGDRLRFTLAHEIGHAIMHQNSAGGDIEEQAHRFAAEFLMPANEVEPHLHKLTLRDAAILKQQWKVSMAAIIRRSHDLKCITDWRYRSLNVQLGTEGYRTVEPFPVPIEEPQLIQKLVQAHRAELGYDEFDLAKLLFRPDRQFFGPQERPSILKINDRPFFAFFPDPAQRRKIM